MGKSTGYSRFLIKEQEKELYKVITTNIPDEIGFGYAKNQNFNIARKWVSDNFNVEYNNRCMLQVIIQVKS